MLRRLIREPFLHFVVIGGLLFLIYSMMNPDTGKDGSRRISVDESVVNNLTQEFVRQWRRPPDRVELSGLIEAHLREEVLYREAKALGLDHNDKVIRLRLAQKMEALATMGAETVAAPEEEELRAYFARHAGNFAEPAQLSFTQIFLNPDSRGSDARDDALSLLGQLRTSGSVDPRGLGDMLHLPFSHQMVTQREVARLFGSGFSEELFEVPANGWHGPVESGFGLHLVLVSERIPPRVPPFEDVAVQVRARYLENRRDETRLALLEDMKQGYEVVFSGLDVGVND